MRVIERERDGGEETRRRGGEENGEGKEGE